ncbi:MAG: hypothetical protein AB1430_05400 [Pseudomonadota bacterium]
MSRMLPLVAALSFTALALAAGPTRAAQHDAVAACPRLAQHLQDELQPVVARFESPGFVHVRFQARGGQPARVRVAGVPQRYHWHVRHALRSLRCEGLAAGEEYVLNIEFRES